MTDARANFDVEEQRIRIDRSVAETEEFVAVIPTASATAAGAAFFKLFGH